MSGISDLERRLGVRLPPGYRRWAERGALDLDAPDETYLWVAEAEWIPAAALPGYDLVMANPLPGLVPFAFTGRADHWCWNTQAPTGDGEYEVLLCCRGEPLAAAYAPTFPGWFYRNALVFAGSLEREPERIEEARAHLRRWSAALAEIGPAGWARHLDALASAVPFEHHPPGLHPSVVDLGLLSSAETDAIVGERFGRRYLADQVRWFG